MKGLVHSHLSVIGRTFLKSMKQSFYISCSILLLITMACKDSIEKGQRIQLTNTSQFTLSEKPIKIDINKLRLPSDKRLLPIVISSNDTLPSQINDTNDDNEWDELFF